MLSRFPLIDGHNDLPWEIREKFGLDPVKAGLTGRVAGTHTDIPRLVEGGVGGQFWSVYVPSSLAGDAAVTAVFEQVDIVHRMIAAYPGRFQLALTADDVDDGVQGGQDRLPARRGGRPLHQQLARRAPLAVRARRPLHDADAQRQRRLGRLGDRRAGLRRPVRLRPRGRGGDAAPRHARRPVARGGHDDERRPGHGAGPGDLLALVSARALTDNPRNVPDDVLARLAVERRRVHGGVRPVLRLAGVHRLVQRRSRRSPPAAASTRTTWREVFGLLPEWEKGNPMPAATLAQVADHIDHVREVAGLAHVGIGGDFDGTPVFPRGPATTSPATRRSSTSCSAATGRSPTSRPWRAPTSCAPSATRSPTPQRAR